MRPGNHDVKADNCEFADTRLQLTTGLEKQ